MSKTGSQRVKDCHDRKVASGLKLVKVWIPVALVEKLKAYAAKLRKSET